MKTVEICWCQPSDFAEYTWLVNVYDVWKSVLGRENECRIAAILEYRCLRGHVRMLTSGTAGNNLQSSLVMWTMGFASAEFAGAGAALCLAIGTWCWNL